METAPVVKTLCLCFCVQEGINTTSFQFSEQNGKKNSTHAHLSFGVCVY